MKLTLLILMFSQQLFSQNSKRIYIVPETAGFDTYLAAAIQRQKLPVTIVTASDQADYVLGSITTNKDSSSAGKILGCLLTYCAAGQGNSQATIQLINPKTSVVVWSYAGNAIAGRAYLYLAGRCIASLKKQMKKGNVIL